MQPPITHYKDEPADPSVQSVVESEIDKEIKDANPDAGAPEPQLKVLPVKKVEKKPTNASNIVNAFRQRMASTTTPISLPSIGKTVEFREISTAEQKEMSKIAMQSNSRSDLMYCAMVAMINKLAVEKGFDIRDYTEFERIFVTLNLQQLNKINPEIKFTCKSCGRENSYRLDTPKMLRKFEKCYKPDEEFVVDANVRKFTFTAGWPSVRSIEDFFRTYFRKYDSASKGVKDSINSLSQIEYVTMFLKKVLVEETSSEEDAMAANLEEMTYTERAQIIDCRPQNVVFDEDTGVVGKVIEAYVNPINDVFKYNNCVFCGAEQDGQVANLSDFIG